MQASATGSAVSRPTLMTRPKYAAKASPNRAWRPEARANTPPRTAMAATPTRLITTSTTGTNWCWPNEISQASTGYPTRVYR